MSILGNLYAGELRPEEDFGCSKDEEYQELIRAFNVTEEAFVPCLKEDDLKTYEELKFKNAQMCNMELERMFCYAFRTGFLLSMEIFQEAGMK